MTVRRIRSGWPGLIVAGFIVAAAQTGDSGPFTTRGHRDIQDLSRVEAGAREADNQRAVIIATGLVIVQNDAGGMRWFRGPAHRRAVTMPAATAQRPGTDTDPAR